VSGLGLALLVVAAAVLAGALPGLAGAIAAEAAFVLTIPFMSTALPYALGVALLGRRSRARRASRGASTQPAEAPA
jgi:undecaprenyl pyrophosphate phosphatase UppP